MRAARRAPIGALLLLLAGCGGATATTPGAASAPEESPRRVVATTTILGDIAGNVAEGCRAQVSVLMSPGQDPHAFRASAAQATEVQEADLVLASGLGLEEGLREVLEAAASVGVDVLRLGEEIEPRPGGKELDPHFWLDPVQMVKGVSLLGARLGAVAPESASCFAAAADSYGNELLAVHEATSAMLAGIPPQKRVLVTNHDALGHFAERYEFEVAGVIIPGGSTLAEPSAADLAVLVDEIEATRAPAIFAETTRPIALAEAIAAEVGHDVAVVELHTGSLGEPGSGVATYLELLRINAARIASALA